MGKLRGNFRVLGAVTCAAMVFLTASALFARNGAPLLPVSATADAKRDELWSRVVSSEYSAGNLPSAGPGFLDLTNLVVAS